jgi:glycosyltransferase involved in cell wall biosynthesis
MRRNPFGKKAKSRGQAGAGKVTVSIVLPCRNEESTIAACVEEGWRALGKAGVSGEVVVVDNGSDDDSASVAKKCGARVVPCLVPGYGAALDCGICAARGRYVLMLDADGSYDPGSLPEFMGRLRQGDVLVVGNRFRGGIEPGAMPWKNRLLGNPILSWMGRVMFGVKIGDFHCGIRAFRREAILQLGLQSTGMEYASEMIVRSALACLRIGEVPVVLRRDRRGRASHLRPWRDGWRHLRFLLLFSPRWLFVIPGLALMVLGSIMGVLSAGSWAEGGNGRLLLMSFLGVSAGCQFFLFGMLTRVFGVEYGFLPEPRGYRSLFRLFTLERGLLAGALVLAGGLFVLGKTGVRIGPNHFPWPWGLGGGLLVSIGLQTILTSFLFSFLGLPFQRKRAPCGLNFLQGTRPWGRS